MNDDEKLHELLGLLANVEDHGSYWTAQCPAHDDRANSLSINRGDKVAVVLKCHAECSTPSILHAMGRTMSWLFPDHGKQGKKSRTPKGSLVAAYDYCDEDGVLLRQSCRYESVDDDGKKTKTFTQRRPNGQGGWVGSLKGTRNVPYRLPELIASHKSEMVFIVEGEKHVDKLREFGMVATCNVGGAGKWNKSFGQFLVGRNVTILPDNDEPGQKHAADVAEKLADVAKSIRCVVLPNLPPKGDVMDWLAAGGTAEQLRALAENQAPGVPERPVMTAPDPVPIDHDKTICEQLGLFVYGEDDSGRVKVFSEYHRKSQLIRDVNRLTMSDLLRICGPVARQLVYAGNDDDLPEGMYRIKAVRESISVLAGFRRVTDDSEVGIGVWEAASESAGNRDSIVLVNAGEAAILNGHPQLRRHAKPKYGELFLDLGSSSPWFDFDEVDGYLRDYSVEWAKEVVAEAEGIFSKWRFPPAHQQITPGILVGLVMASWVQTVWRWRPQVFLYGKSASGKSTFFQTLAGNEDAGQFGMFGRLAMSSGDVSAAGVAQALSSTARIAVLDELERSPHRAAIMQMLRNSGGGSSKLRGSTHHKAVQFKLRHLVWAAATETGLKQEPDTNRFIAIELVKPPDDEMGDLDIPPDEDLQRLGYKLLAISIKTVQAARSLVERLKAVKPHGYHARVVETYAVPAACYAMGMGMSDDQAAELHAMMLRTHDTDSIEADEMRLLSDIMEAIIDVKPGLKLTVAQAIRQARYPHDTDGCGEALERHGVAVMHQGEGREMHTTWVSGDETCVFFSPNAVNRHLLKGTEWTHANISQVISRIPGAVRCKKTIANQRPQGILVGVSKVVYTKDDSF